ncbi:DUF5995 family protein [Fodinibius salsisoli]|uniref:Uncharacterized protein n=1 Tax=Fodinibius salsisoli TaxID=2820877 RepID=A0ABT3PI66_9BACT|nr:DUF5995 family protein [Fodinibius salsisoli]MCW9705616.1 hypothetical protein [Fodinibius salsisoli]
MPDQLHNPIESPEFTDIDDVLAALDQIIDLSIKENSTAALFAYVYRRTTAKVKQGIEEGRFDDNDRMELFDVAFAGKYIEAYWQYRNGEEVPEVWEQAFSPAKDNQLILQYILLGMNAHINYDLGIAAAEFSRDGNIQDLKADFMLINQLLEELVDEIQGRISRVSPMVFLLDWMGKNNDEAIINFSINKARGQAWNFAVRLTEAPQSHKADIIAGVDQKMTSLARLVSNPPGFFLPKVLGVIRYFETKDVGSVIHNIQQKNP